MMRILAAFLLFLLILPTVLSGSDFKSLVKKLEKDALEYAREIEIDSLKLALRYGGIEFGEGRLLLFGIVDNRPTGAFYIGRGEFEYYPPDATEAHQVNRFYGDDSLAVKFDQIYLASPSISEIFSEIDKDNTVSEVSGRMRRHIREIRSIPSDKFKYNLPMHVARSLMEGKHDYLWVDFLQGRLEHTVYLYDPYAREPVSILKISPKFKKPQWVSSYMDTMGSAARPVLPVIDLLYYDIDVDISTYSKSTINCTMSLEVKTDSLIVLSFDFPAEYSVDYVWGDVADSLSFFKRKEWPGVALVLDRFYHRGDTIEVGLKYSTNMFYHYMNAGVVPENLVHWYPYNGYRDMSDYSVTYTIDDGYGFIAVGDRVRRESDHGKEKFEYWAENVAYISFNYGLFDTLAVAGAQKPIYVYLLPAQHQSPLFGNPNIDRVADDIRRSFEFFSDNFLPYQFSEMAVVAMSTPYGQGSPGVVYLPSSTFTQSRPGFDDKLRAHEVAHQWWGHTINPASYRDVWLSEGLAEYSAALYLKEVKNEEKTFRDILKDWRRKILQRGRLRGRKSDGYRAGAISLGTRLLAEISPGDFEALIYFKAAYMLHMLEIEMAQVTGDGGSLMAMLAEFAERYAGQSATTQDFINTVSDYLGEETDQFFAQWLYDWRIPKIKTEYEVNSTGPVIIEIEVEEISDSFTSSYPVRFNFAGGRKIDTLYDIKAGSNRFIYIPPEEVGVKSVEFNLGYDILEK